MNQGLPDDPKTMWSRYLDDRESVWRAFRDIRERDHSVVLRFESVDTVYSARVREVDHRRVTIEDVHPRSGEALLNAGRSFALSSRFGDAYLYAPDNVPRGSSPGPQGSAFVIDLPARLLWQQRRRGPRYTLPASLRAGRARITLVRGMTKAPGLIEDISAGGCRALFEASAADLLAEGATFEGARIEIAGLLSIVARVAIRHRAIDVQTGAVTCRFEILRTDPDDAGRLEQFLRSLANRVSQR
jgi:hypothetical protein